METICPSFSELQLVAEWFFHPEEDIFLFSNEPSVDIFSQLDS